MAFVTAITGKGGVGKTTISGLLVSRLVAAGKAPVLAVDADPNSCLDSVLGVKVEKTVGRIREEVREKAVDMAGRNISKQEMLEMRIAECLVEAKDFDLIAMGRPEGPGCYCYANNVLKEIIAKISDQYPAVVIDNEAGLENISRRIVRRLDLLIMAGDSSRNGMLTMARLHQLAQEMRIEYGMLALVINRCRDGKPPQGAEELKGRLGADFLVPVPEDAEIAAMSEKGYCVSGLPPANRVVSIVDSFIQNIFSRRD